MSGKTEPPASAEAAGSAPVSAGVRQKPRFSLFIATACGLGYLPKAPGTWGSLGGAVLAMLPFWGPLLVSTPLNQWGKLLWGDGVGISFFAASGGVDPFLVFQFAIAAFIALIGVWSAGNAARFWETKDPQRVVIDEVSGQHLTLLMGCALPLLGKTSHPNWAGMPLGLVTVNAALNWKYLALGFILFRIFDIWKPFPARQAESLPGGWGIMADDWVAGIYAGLVLWIARLAGL
ncbi:MAG TPA: phosphatidylglycerophosphatase A [Candidatus Limnocylindrales bacterium]|nr:phosphatidylglycerophosphatase A [Candidatus Limnocylindrales bacterium]